MLPQNNPDRIRIVFDDHRLVANAGLLLPATLAQHLGRREARLTQAEVADLTGLSLSAIRRYEYGSANPETGTLDTLASIYDKPAGWFTPRGYFTVKERYQFQQSVRPRASGCSYHVRIGLSWWQIPILRKTYIIQTFGTSIEEDNFSIRERP